MTRAILFCFSLILALSLSTFAQRRIVPPVVLISIDGLKPDYVFKPTNTA
jgi:predicted AlkP superfamily pyrophosphatase or phosphodiesterase